LAQVVTVDIPISVGDYAYVIDISSLFNEDHRQQSAVKKILIKKKKSFSSF